MPIPNIHILGIQGSGKGTQSALLVQQFDFLYLAAGNLFRERAEQHDELGEIIREELKAGRLLPDLLLFRVIKQKLETGPLTQGILGDGVIRTVSQHKGLLPMWEEAGLDLPLLINLQLDEKTALDRIAQREKEKDDPTKRPYHEVYSGKLLKRTDDNAAAIGQRFATFHKLTQPVVQEFTAMGRCINIDANQPVETINANIVQAIKPFYPNF